MTILDINACQIPKLTNYTLYGLSSLGQMFMYQNAITEIQPGAFQWFSGAIREYWLGINKLTTLDQLFRKEFEQKQV